MGLDEYKKLYLISKNGIYSRESYIKDNLPEIYSIINDRYKDIPFVEAVYMLVNNIDKRPTCHCGLDVKFKNRTIGYQKFCSNRCSTLYNSNNLKNKIVEIYGVKHSSQTKKSKERRISRKLHQVTEIISGSGKLIKHDYLSDIFTLECFNCGMNHHTSYQVLRQRKYLGLSWCDCITSSYKTSSMENELRIYIQSIYEGVVILNDKNILKSGKEIDIFLPEIGVGFEFNGLWWHNEINKQRKYHYDKWNECSELGIGLIQIYEDEWLFKKDIVKSRIKSVIGCLGRRIYARKCSVRRIDDFMVVRTFLEANHLQGHIKSSYNFGLYYGDELVSVMTFGRPRLDKRNSTDLNVFELYRFSSKLDTCVVGGASKLFKHFLNFFKPDEVFSFSSNEWLGNLYVEIGMKLTKIIPDSYWYIDKGIRVSRHNYKKHKLVKMGYDKEKSESEILREMKIYRIWGAGNKLFTWCKDF